MNLKYTNINETIQYNICGQSLTRVPKPGKTPFFIRSRSRFYWVFPDLIFATYTALSSKNGDITGLLPGYTGLVQLLTHGIAKFADLISVFKL